MMKRTLKYALLLTSMSLLPSVLTKNGYASCDSGTFNETIGEPEAYFNNAADEKMTCQDQVYMPVIYDALGGLGGTGITEHFLRAMDNRNITGNSNSPFWVAGNYAAFVHDTNHASQSISLQLHYGRSDTVEAVPEPEAYVILLSGVGLLGTSARRRHKTMNI